MTDGRVRMQRFGACVHAAVDASPCFLCLPCTIGCAVSCHTSFPQVTVNLTVTDLHSVTPSSFLELCGGSVHALSYQQARNNRAAVGQVYVAEAGYMLSRAAVPKHAIITQLSGKPTPNLEAFAAVLRALPHGARVPLEYFTFAERHRRKNVILHIDRQWYGPPVYWTRDDAEGTWHPTTKWPPGVLQGTVLVVVLY